jgi:hypothetical protein
MNKKIKNFLAEKKVGLILRSFTTKEEDIPNRISMMKETIEKALPVEIDGTPVISRIDILVFSNSQHKLSDCGKTYGAMNESFLSYDNVFVTEIKQGDVFCSILNNGIMIQSMNNITHSMIASSEVNSYINQEIMIDMIEALSDGAKVTGVAINELTDSVRAGRIANTMAIWDNIALMTVGGFDLRAAKPVHDKDAFFMKGFNSEKGTVYYHLAGVEEVIPIARLIDIHGKCVAPILPKGDGAQIYVEPNPVKDQDLYERHISKMGTKFERQCVFLAHIYKDMSYIKGGVMDNYPK